MGLFVTDKMIKIACKGATEVSLAELIDLQGNLKELDDPQYAKLRNSITEYGFSFPVFMWEDPKDNKKYIIDAHQRIRTLRRMETEGFTIPRLPADYIHAKDKVEAKEKLLLLNSNYGKITQEGLYEFMNEEGAELKADELEDFVEIEEFSREYDEIEDEPSAPKEKHEECVDCTEYHNRNHTI